MIDINEIDDIPSFTSDKAKAKPKAKPNAKQMQIRIDAHLLEIAHAYCADNDVTLSQLVRKLLRTHLSNEQQQGDMFNV